MFFSPVSESYRRPVRWAVHSIWVALALAAWAANGWRKSLASPASFLWLSVASFAVAAIACSALASDSARRFIVESSAEWRSARGELVGIAATFTIAGAFFVLLAVLL